MFDALSRNILQPIRCGYDHNGKHQSDTEYHAKRVLSYDTAYETCKKTLTYSTKYLPSAKYAWFGRWKGVLPWRRSV